MIMASDYTEHMQDQDLFVDESGLTSMEPEGTDPHHHHTGDWRPAEKAPRYGRAEGRVSPDPDFERGPRPVEGDGDGAPG